MADTFRVKSTVVRARAALIVLPAKFSGRVSDPTGKVAEVRKALGEKMLQLVKDTFLQKTKGWRGDDGIKWKPLSKQAAKRKRLGILLVTQNLFNKFFFDPTPRPDQRGLSFTIRNRAWYHRFHHEGTGTIPARPSWPETLPKKWRKELMKVIKEGCSDLVRRIMGVS